MEVLCSGTGARHAAQRQNKVYLLAEFLISIFKILKWLDENDRNTFISEEINKELSNLKNSKSRSGNKDSVIQSDL